MYTLSKMQGSLLALLILVLILGAFTTITVVPVWLANQHYRETIDGMESRLEQLQRAGAIGASLQPQYEQLRLWQSTETRYLKSTSAALAAAELQRLVKQIAVTKRTQILSTQILPATEEKGLTRVSLKVHMRGKLEGIVESLHAIETGKPYMFLDNLSIRSLGNRRGRSTAITLQQVEVNMELFAYMPNSP